MQNPAFRFSRGTTIAVTTSITATTVAFLGIDTHFRIVNNSGSLVYMSLGDATTADASTTDCPILSGVIEIFRRVPDKETHISLKTAAGTGTVYVTGGEGT